MDSAQQPPLPRARRKWPMWKLLAVAGGLCLPLLLIAVGIAAWPKWQEWRLASYIDQVGGDFERDDEHGPMVRLTLPDDAIRRIDLERLKTLKQLTSIEITSSHVDPEHLEALADLSELYVVSLQDSFIYGDALKHLVRLPQLKFLNLYGAGLEDEGTLSLLSDSRTLGTVNLDNAKISDTGAKELARCAALTEVHLDDTAVGDDAASSLAQMPNLATLSLDRTKITDEGVRALSTCRSLTWLSLAETKVTGRSLGELASLPQLACLHLDDTKLTDETAAELAKLTHLTSLSLRNLPLTDAAVPHLTKLTNLTSIDVDGTKIGDEGAWQLANLPNLQSLSIITPNVTQAGVERLHKKFPNVPGSGLNAPLFPIVEGETMIETPAP